MPKRRHWRHSAAKKRENGPQREILYRRKLPILGAARTGVPGIGRDDDSYCWTVRPGYWRSNVTCDAGG